MELKKFHLPLPEIPGVVKPYEFKISVFILLIFLVLTFSFVAWKNQSLWPVLVILIVVLDFIRSYFKPDIALEKSAFRVVYKNGHFTTHQYTDFDFYIDSPPALALSKGYRYRLSLRSKLTIRSKFVLYPSLFMPDNVRAIVEKIQNSISEPLRIVFQSEKIANDYLHAYDIKL